jgi:hypothetical protein
MVDKNFKNINEVPPNSNSDGLRAKLQGNGYK